MITLDLRRITRAKDLQETANRALEVTKQALAPRLSDTGLIAEIYAHFCDFVKGLGKSHHSERRREFMFIIAYLYCPSVLIGASMPRGFRGVLKELLHVESPSAISNYTTDLFFLYNHYKDFRDVVEGAYNHIACSMSLDSAIGD